MWHFFHLQGGTIPYAPWIKKNTFGPLGGPILAATEVLTCARQHICTFCYVSWHRWPKNGKSDIFHTHGVIHVHMPPEHKKYFWTPRGPYFGPNGGPNLCPSAYFHMLLHFLVWVAQKGKMHHFCFLQGGKNQYWPWIINYLPVSITNKGDNALGTVHLSVCPTSHG